MANICSSRMRGLHHGENKHTENQGKKMKSKKQERFERRLAERRLLRQEGLLKTSAKRRSERKLAERGLGRQGSVAKTTGEPGKKPAAAPADRRIRGERSENADSRFPGSQAPGVRKSRDN